MKARGIKIFSIILGSVCLAGGLIGTLVIAIEQIVFTAAFIHEPELDLILEPFLIPLFRLMMIFLPFLALIGLGYLLFGIRYNKIKSGKYAMSVVGAVATIVWYAAFAVGMILLVQRLMVEVIFDYTGASTPIYVVLGVSFISGYIYYGVPQLLITRWVKKDESTEQADSRTAKV